MREFAKVSPKIWFSDEGREIKEIGMEAHHVSIYLLTNPHANMIGIYYLPIKFIAHEVGIHEDLALELMKKLCEVGYCDYDFRREFVWVCEMGISQIGSELSARDNRVKGVNEAYHALPNLSFLQSFYDKYVDVFLLERHPLLVFPHLQLASKPLASKEKEIEKENEKKKEKEREKEGAQASPCAKKYISLFENKNQTEKPSDCREQAVGVLQFLNKVANKAFEPTIENLRDIIERLTQGETEDVCRCLIVKKSRQWLNDKKMDSSLNPVTLFKSDNFYRYKGELVMPKESMTDVAK